MVNEALIPSGTSLERCEHINDKKLNCGHQKKYSNSNCLEHWIHTEKETEIKIEIKNPIETYRLLILSMHSKYK